MTSNRNPILLGQAEVIDLLQPQVRAMVENEGLYVGGDSRTPEMVVPLVSQNGRIFSMKIDEPLDPERFLPTLTLHGPYFAAAPAPAPTVGVARGPTEELADFITRAPEDRLHRRLLELGWSAPGSTQRAYPTGSDREVLLYLMQQFDAEWWECARCGHSEDCATMDLADYLRRYLAAAPAVDGRNHKLDTDDQVFFYEQDFYVLSNFSAFTLEWKGRRFDTSEAAYHWEKFPDAPEVQDMLLEAPSAHAAFKLAESQKVFRRRDWDEVKLDVMRSILRAKASQHEYVRRKLLATGTRELIEDSWRDDYWGWGPNRDGQNWLGRLWMEVRGELREALARQQLVASEEVARG